MSRKANKTKAVAAKEVVGGGYTSISPYTHNTHFVALNEIERREQTGIDSAFKASKQEALIKARALIIEAMGGECAASPHIRETVQCGFTTVLSTINETIGNLR